MRALRGLFVTFEGGDRTGKTTQLAALAEHLRDAGRTVVSCREPGGTALGERLRDALFARSDGPSPAAELLVFAAARAQLVEEVIRPALASGAAVLCDRFADSTVAYQQFGRGLDAAVVAAVNAAATGGLTPDLTVLLDMPARDALLRGDGGESDYMERQDLAFHERVHAGYRELAAGAPQRWLVLDAARPADEITEAVWSRVAQLI